MRKLSLFLLMFFVIFTIPCYAQRNYDVKTDGFLFLVDYSGSMMMTDNKTGLQKISLVKQALTRINSALPNEYWRAGMFTLAPYHTLVPIKEWNRSYMQEQISTISTDAGIFSRFTNIGDDISLNLSHTIPLLGKKPSIILFTDGENNKGQELSEVLYDLKQAYPSLKIHIVCFNDTKKINILSNGLYIDGRKLATGDNEIVKYFIKNVFINQYEQPTLYPNVTFDFAKYVLTKYEKEKLRNLVSVICSDTRRILVSGYADEIGSSAKNLVLSQKRANAVKKYLISLGVPSKRIVANGLGESKHFGSDTAGRAKNRRVEIVFE